MQLAYVQPARAERRARVKVDRSRNRAQGKFFLNHDVDAHRARAEKYLYRRRARAPRSRSVSIRQTAHRRYCIADAAELNYNQSARTQGHRRLRHENFVIERRSPFSRKMSILFSSLRTIRRSTLRVSTSARVDTYVTMNIKKISSMPNAYLYWRYGYRQIVISSWKIN